MKEIGAEIKAKKTMQIYMSMSRHQNAGQNENINTSDTSIETVTTFE
jgi:hypothetical protein